jgi:hypothetical protein
MCAGCDERGTSVDSDRFQLLKKAAQQNKILRRYGPTRPLPVGSTGWHKVTSSEARGPTVQVIAAFRKDTNYKAPGRTRMPRKEAMGTRRKPGNLYRSSFVFDLTGVAVVRPSESPVQDCRSSPKHRRRSVRLFLAATPTADGHFICEANHLRPEVNCNSIWRDQSADSQRTALSV